MRNQRLLFPDPAASAAVGGLLWVPYGVFETLEPLGRDTAFDASRGYEVVVDRPLHALYALPGGLALVCSALALLIWAARSPGARVAATGRGLAGAAMAAGLVSLVGVAVGFDPIFTAARVLGTLLLGASAVLIARSVMGTPGSGHLAMLGGGCLALLPLWPLMYAVEAAPPVAGAAVIAAVGVGWIVWAAQIRPAGGPRRRARRHHPTSPPRPGSA